MKYICSLVLLLQFSAIISAASVFYFSDGLGIAWCDLTQVANANISACTTANSHYAPLGTYNLALTGDGNGNVYAVLSNSQSQFEIWKVEFDASASNFTTYVVGTFTAVGLGGSTSRITAQYVPNFNSSGTDAVVVGTNTTPDFGSSTYLIVSASGWSVIYSTKAFLGTNVEGLAVLGDYLYVSSSLLINNADNSTAVAFDFNSPTPTTASQVFVCNGHQIPYCHVFAMIQINGDLYFSTGWQIWVISASNPLAYKLWYQYDQQHVNGVFGPAFTDGQGGYWYFDSMRNTNYVANGVAYQGSNAVAKVSKNFPSSAVVV